MAQISAVGDGGHLETQELHDIQQQQLVSALYITTSSSIAVATTNGEIRMFDVWGQQGTILQGHEKTVWCFTSTGNYLISGAADAAIIV